MKIGIDISQLTYRNTGVANYLKHLTQELVKQAPTNDYILFYSSLRGCLSPEDLPTGKNVIVKKYPFPPKLLAFMWNTLHLMPIEWLIGNVDVFITSDWTEPPTKKAKKATILYDLIVYKYPEESTPKIVTTQKRKLSWVKKETDAIFCISEATKKDAMEILGIKEEKIKVIYPGV